MSNEGKVCDAVIRFLEKREHATRADLTFPDGSGHAFPVEIAMRLNTILYALEHTLIEPFPQQIGLGIRSKKFFDPMIRAVEAFVPLGECYCILVPVDAVAQVSASAFQSTRDKLVAWIRETAPKLHIIEANRLDLACSKIAVPEVPFAVSLSRQRQPTTTWPRVKFSCLVPDTEQPRRDRIDAGYNKKLPKLVAWKTFHAARTVLILENNDIQLTNHIVVAEAVLSIVAGASARPDEIFLVSTCVEPWEVIPMLIGGTTVFDLAENWIWQIGSSSLNDLTNR